MRLRSSLALAPFAASLALTLACGDPPAIPPGTPPPTPGEGEGEPIPGEGEGEPEPVPGGDIDVVASGVTTNDDSARADGVTVIEVTVTLVGHEGEPIAGRPVTLVTSGAVVLFEQPAPTGVDGRTTTLIRAEAPGVVSVHAEMPDNGSTASTGALELTFEPCLSLVDTFEHEMWGPVFSRCVGCHNEYGLPITAEWNNRHILKFPGEVDFAEHNVDVLRVLALEDGTGDPGISYLVAMPTLRFGHSGGEVIPQGSLEEQMLIGFSERLRAAVDTCGAGADIPAERVMADVGVVTRRETLARAKQALLGVPLDDADLALPLASDAELEAAVDALLDDPRASDRVVEIYNDWLWTDRFTREVSRSTGGANIVLARLGQQYPRRGYFQEPGGGGLNCDPATQVCCGEAGSPYPGTCEQPVTEDNAANSLAREPLELIRHIWQNDLRADAIANADFTMANPYTAILYGFTPANAEWTFDDDNSSAQNRSEYRPFVLRDTAANAIDPQPGVGNRYPHAGILTAHTALLRYPATTSNRERRRASRLVYERMLGIDVMKLAEFSTSSLPADADLDTATRSEIACTACHAVMDPVARTLFSFTENGQYDPGRARAPANEMFEAAFMGERFCNAGDDFCSGAIQGANADQTAHVGDGVTWLAERVVTSPRFPYAMTIPLFSGLMATPVVRPFSDPQGDRFAEKNLAFSIQNTYLTELAQRFDGVHDRNLKALAKDIIMGPYFRAGSYSGDADSVEARALALAGVGRGTLITPEQLSRKLFALTGERAGQPNNGGTGDFLRNFDEYRLLFGGVNWESLTVRFRDPNPTMMKVIERVANQVGCRVVVEDFARVDASARRLLAPDLTPADVSEARVRDELVALRLKLLGEERAAGDEEISALYELFVAARQAAGDAPENNLGTACRQVADADHNALSADGDGTIRAWMAVTAALLSDPLFFVE